MEEVAQYAEYLICQGWAAGVVQSIMAQGCQGTRHLAAKEEKKEKIKERKAA